MTKEAIKKPDYLGHRERMNAKLLEKGASAFTSSEILEMILMRTIPRIDVKPIARELLRRFGSFDRVINADPQELYETKYVKESTSMMFSLIQAACEIMLTPRRNERIVISDFVKLADYLRVKLAFQRIEYAYAIYLNRGCEVLVSEMLRSGYEGEVPVYPREILQRALNLKASSVILVHNHPSGNARPSSADLDLTDKIEKMLNSAEIKLYDHLIVSFEKIYSIKTRSFLTKRT